MNYLNAVLWDYPKLTDPDYLREFIGTHGNESTRSWLLTRFLEYARVIDTWKYFSMREIAAHLPELELTPHARKKWKRMIEVYGNSEGK